MSVVMQRRARRSTTLLPGGEPKWMTPRFQENLMPCGASSPTLEGVDLSPIPTKQIHGSRLD
jgi:hypothetical protein